MVIQSVPPTGAPSKRSRPLMDTLTPRRMSCRARSLRRLPLRSHTTVLPRLGTWPCFGAFCKMKSSTVRTCWVWVCVGVCGSVWAGVWVHGWFWSRPLARTHARLCPRACACVDMPLAMPMCTNMPVGGRVGERECVWVVGLGPPTCMHAHMVAHACICVCVCVCMHVCLSPFLAHGVAPFLRFS